jgi:predicted nucleotidyltransferase
MNINEVFSTQQRLTILKNIIFRDEWFGITQISKYSNISKGLVSKYLNLLVEENILEKNNSLFRVKGSLNTKALKILLNLTSINTDLFKDKPIIRSAGIYGSTVKGTNTEDSDVDLWIVHEPTSTVELSKITKELTGHHKIKPLYLTVEKIEELKTKDPVFYYNLLFSSITLYGEGLDVL